ncbi:hypothetical protein SAMN05444159_7153 [Bradyrhizobium lablabi]|uniref:Uncharacterized protein n=1 Tax=Bradyrhizobium lablabi TaxID=722472 RepID=A0A1M7EG01_9BRAD|nr:hypothetical protein [Bradyrhizobium lablabi]SHL90647.1 hypothetical protein SAMN05444159_7153 [Bradyrhizobium lablabi]
MPADYSHRHPRGLDHTMRFLQVDSSWYENYWLEERKPRPAGMVTRNLPTIVSCLRLACDRVASVRRAVLAIVLRPKTHPEIGTHRLIASLMAIIDSYVARNNDLAVAGAKLLEAHRAARPVPEREQMKPSCNPAVSCAHDM